ncbi:MAG: right-handed parallel beta-helix repeat-containing protein [Frankiaceae bacterium]
MTGDRRRMGVYALVAAAVAVAAAVCTFLVGRNHNTVYSTATPFHRHILVPAFDPVTDAILGLDPNSTNVSPSPPLPWIRAIVASPTGIKLMAGGRLMRQVPLTRPAESLADVFAAVNDPSWLGQPTRGSFIAHAALIARDGTAWRFAAPTVRSIVLESKPGIFLAVNRASLDTEGVSVTSSVPHASDDRGEGEDRPFVLADRGSTMWLRNSVFSNLGRDWNSSYGVSWSGGSTGGAVSSVFQRGFMGVYTDHSHDLLFRGNVFRDNTLYGLDPHSYTTTLVAERNVAEGNGRHGIIFSDHVTGSVVRNNVTRNNELNGIMMDFASSGNLISGNLTAHNHGDGLVFANSPGNFVVDNTVVDNRVGIYARGEDTVQREIRGNRITDNALAAQGVDVVGNTMSGNGGQWMPRRVGLVWAVAVPVTVLMWLATWWARRARGRSPRRPPRALHPAGVAPT